MNSQHSTHNKKTEVKLSVVLATRNEEENIARCIKSVKEMFADLPAQAGEIVVVDEYSKDKTREIAVSFGTKVYLEEHHDIFHVTKQKALRLAQGEWILQLDADEVVTQELAKQIIQVVNHQPLTFKHNQLFIRHQKLIEERDGLTGKSTGDIVGYFIPRRNMFLGKPLIHAGVYPDGVIRLVKNGYASFPQKSVHEQITLDGKVGWLNGDLLHYDSPTLKRYFARLNRYTDLHAEELKENNVSKGVFSFVDYVFIKPFLTFMKLFFRHLGFLDGVNGFLWSLFSSWHFPIAYFKYLTNNT